MNTPEEREKLEEERLARAIMRSGHNARPSASTTTTSVKHFSVPSGAAGGGTSAAASALRTPYGARVTSPPLTKPLPDPAAPKPPTSIDGDDIVAELNAARADPAGLAARFSRELRGFRGTVQSVAAAGEGAAASSRETVEGLPGVEEAVRWLAEQQRRPALEVSPALGKCARDVCLDHGFAGLTSSSLRDGTDRPTRLRRYGRCNGRVEEVFVFGAFSALDAVAQAVVCDGERSRESRRLIFDPSFTVGAAYCSMHEKYGNMVSIVLATDYEVAGERRAAPRIAEWAAPKQSAPSPLASTAPAPQYGFVPIPEPRPVAAPAPVFTVQQPAAVVRIPTPPRQQQQQQQQQQPPQPVVYHASAPEVVTVRRQEPAPAPAPEAVKSPKQQEYTYPAPQITSPRSAQAPEPQQSSARPPSSGGDTINETDDAYIVDLGHTGEVTSMQLFKKGLGFVLRSVTEDGVRREQRIKLPFPFAAQNVTATWNGDNLILNIKKVTVTQASEDVIMRDVVLHTPSATTQEPNLSFTQGDKVLVATITGGNLESKLTLKITQSEVARSTVRFEFEQIRNTGTGQEKVIRTKTLKMPFISNPSLITHKEIPVGIEPVDLASASAFDPRWEREWLPAGATWESAPWFILETWFYARVRAASGPHLDVFSPQKRALLDQCAAALPALCEVASRADDERSLAALVRAGLRGNTADLSMHPDGASVSDGVAMLIDDVDAAAAGLCGRRGASVAIVADNAGFEICCDLALADWLLASGVASRVFLHIKAYPTFVSDVTQRDLDETVARVAGGELCAEAASMGKRWQGLLSSGRLVVRPDDFWNSPLPLWDAPEALLDGESLGKCALVVLKGDANYRRAHGDRAWPYTTPTSQIMQYFPTSLLFVRTLKAPVMSGIATEQEVQDLTNKDAKWLVSGKYGLIQLVSKQ
eukprot:m51a1_g766 hypothetical protein (929) ;mRNA; r:563019-567966